MPQTYKYPPMLGPPDEYPVGSPEWAERQGLAISIAVENIEQFGVNRLIPEVVKALDADPRPWQVFPPKKPCRTPEAYFQLMAGISCESLAELIHAYHGEHEIIRRLHAAKAEENPAGGHGGRRRGELQETIGRLKDVGPNSTERILARLARDRPDILKRYEAGEFRSARAAAIEAGFVKSPTALDQLRRLWKKASVDERQQFRAEVLTHKDTVG